jgi:hypothetical protein
LGTSQANRPFGGLPTRIDFVNPAWPLLIS